MIYKRLKIIAIVLFCCMFHGCGEILPSNTEITEPTESSSSIIIESNMLTCELSEIPFYERLDLRKNEQVIIMDVRGSHLLLNIFEDYPPDDSNFREVGYNSVSHAVAVFDYKKGEIIELRKLEELDYVTDGVFVENGFAYVIMKLDRSGYSSCKLIIVNGNNVLETDLGKYDSSGYSDPRLAVLKNGNIAFSFYDKDSKEFGVKTIDSGGRLTPQIVFVNDGKTKWLTNTLYSNGIEYIYFSAVDELGTFLIGDIDGIKSKFTLAENERIYDYCFLKDSCCFMTIETIDKNGLSKKECIVRSYSGQTLTRNPKNGIYYRITSNNENFIVGIDWGYKPYLLIASESGIDVKAIDAPAAPALFYKLDSENFLIHYNYNYENTIPALYELSIKQNT